eukprot:6950-Pyramimonas_sp.AAC.1
MTGAPGKYPIYAETVVRARLPSRRAAAQSVPQGRAPRASRIKQRRREPELSLSGAKRNICREPASDDGSGWRGPAE